MFSIDAKIIIWETIGKLLFNTLRPEKCHFNDTENMLATEWIKLRCKIASESAWRWDWVEIGLKSLYIKIKTCADKKLGEHFNDLEKSEQLPSKV